jgi:cell division protease FtsH
MNSTVKAVVFWIVIVASAFLLWQVVKTGSNGPAGPEISYSKFVTMVANDQVNSVTIAGNAIRGFDTKGGTFRTIGPQNQATMIDALQQHGVEVWFRETSEQSWPTWLLNLAPLILLGALWFFMIRQMQRRRSGGAGPPTYTPPDESKPHFGP